MFCNELRGTSHAAMFRMEPEVPTELPSDQRLRRSIGRWKLVALCSALASAVAISAVALSLFRSPSEHEQRKEEAPPEAQVVETTTRPEPQTSEVARAALPEPASPTTTPSEQDEDNVSASPQPRAPAATAEEAPAEAVNASEAATPEEPTAVTNADEADAGSGGVAAFVGSNPASPPMSSGAGRFLTESPPWAASAWTSNPNAGAGAFMTTPPPFSASAWTSDPNAGAGAFTTTRDFDPVLSTVRLIEMLNSQSQSQGSEAQTSTR